MNLNFAEQFKRTFSYQNIVYLISTIVFYFFGSGIARYLGQILNWPLLFLGMGYVILLMLSGFYLRAYFDPFILNSKNEKSLSTSSLLEIKRQNLMAGLATLSISCVLVYLIVIGNGTNASLIFFLILTFALMFLFAVPPFKMAARGYGELVLSVWIADLVPVLAFFLHGAEIPKVIPLLTFPLTALFVAMLISTGLQGYLKEMISGQKSLVIMLGWKLGMDLHNWLILAAYLLIAAASLFGLPWNLTWPMLLPIPFFLFSVYELIRIKSGIKPRWSLLNLSGYGGIGCMLYVLLFTLWIR